MEVEIKFVTSALTNCGQIVRQRPGYEDAVVRVGGISVEVSVCRVNSGDLLEEVVKCKHPDEGPGDKPDTSPRSSGHDDTQSLAEPKGLMVSSFSVRHDRWPERRFSRPALTWWWQNADHDWKPYTGKGQA